VENNNKVMLISLFFTKKKHLKNNNDIVKRKTKKTKYRHEYIRKSGYVDFSVARKIVIIKKMIASTK